MRNRFYSKVDWWIGISFGVVICFEVIEVIKSILTKITISSAIEVLIISLCSWILFGTYYEFKENHLLVKSGPSKDRILYDEIKKINLKKSIVASTALSSDRIEIICKGRFGGYISPKQKNEFIEILKSKCPNL
ncbi:PH domain-containing protein (plasmid) [Paraclostridium ghonii]|uniref:PH domain-containing protein n=1 Tax=Paraclostridium ghonii TaxID=29358 RepID=UPI00202CEB6C|nr:PH domain-containing protein [Paeniclostridium ghonii]MCM0166566.1 PH domain-containing protein [Paeniclostridium ghonii]